MPYIVELEKTELWQGWLIANNCWSVFRKRHSVKTVRLAVEWSFLNSQGVLILYRDFHPVKRWSGEREKQLLSLQQKAEDESGISFPIQLQGIKLKFQAQNNQKELVPHPECSWTAGTHTCGILYTLKVWRVSEEQLGMFLEEESTEGDQL